MDKEYIRKLIKLKMDMAGKIVDRLPPAASSKIIEFGNLVLDSIEEYRHVAQSGSSSVPSDKVNKINIE